MKAKTRHEWKVSAIVKAILPILLWLTWTGAAAADEGMWLFNHPPREMLKKRYGFEPSDKWLEHVQLSSVRFNSGGSGSFVSADGLVMTNHHVGANFLQELSDAQHDYLRDGFYASSRADEKPCHGLELNVLVSIEDVTNRVNAAVKPNMEAQTAADARRAMMNEIESESNKTTGFRSDVVTLYQGGAYHLYRYRRYTDVRLVFAPEQQIAFFGGDPDNFEFPRYDFDVCFFRAYESGKPVHLEHYLKWSDGGAAENELIFVSGHPGRTNRLKTVSELNFTRDVEFPYLLQRLYRREVLLSAWSGRSDENARRAKHSLFGVQNSRKAREGGLAGLLEPDLMAKKQSAEDALRTVAAQRRNLSEAQIAWNRIAAAQQVRATELRKFTLLERGAGFDTTLFHIARTLVRAAAESAKPDRERLREYTAAARPSLKLELFSEEPIYSDLETITLENSLTWLAEQLKDETELMQHALAGQSPGQRARELVEGTQLNDVAVRKRLYEGGQKAIDESRDPMIVLASQVDPFARAVRKTMESQVDEVSRQAYAQIAKVKYAVEGNNSYPDATFTLRLAFGTVRGYEEAGKQVPYVTRVSGLYERSRGHHGKPPFDLPQRWVDRNGRLDATTPLNFVSTADIIGGNSGSPVINRQAEVVGLIFDGNIHSLVLDFAYTDKQARAVAVHSQVIVDALRKIYDAPALAAEITGSKHP